MTNEYDVVVIGAGPGGYVAAIRASQLGLKTAIVEKQYWGGVCLNIGCIPSKALLHNAELAHTLTHRGKEFGFKMDNLELDYKVAFKRSRQTSGRLVKGVGFLMKKNKIKTFDGFGKLTGPNTIEVDLSKGGTETLTAKNIILATGARPRQLPGLETDGEKVITYIEAILSDTNPEKAVIVGGGVIGVEFSYMWANYGTDVTIVEMQDALLPGEEPEVSKVLMKAYKKLGVKQELGTVVESIDKSGEKMTVTLKNGKVIKDVDKVMVAVNFVPNVEKLGLESVGVAQEERSGVIIIDDHMRTNVPGIYAIGDVATARYRLAHIATAMGMTAAAVIAGEEVQPLNYVMMPRATYCQPQVASFGYTEAQAKELGYEVNVGQFPFIANGKALGLGEKDGFVKIISDAKYGEILGGHMVGFGVTELLPELTLAQMNELTAHEIGMNVHAHPTMSEALMEAAHAVEGHAVHI
ncbi:MAG: dihydrolipoyl dehydrogenase [Candidatus Promineifilaceae bacterium]